MLGVLARAATSLRLRAADALDAMLGRRDPLIPPRRLNFVGDSDFRLTGDEFLTYLRELAQIKSSDRVLDVGCGIGRIARVLPAVLQPPGGSYDGFDVSDAGIEWCSERYRDTSVPFRFRHVDVHHPHYNTSGSGDPTVFRFPYDDQSFDLVIATSVLTHMLDDTAEHYLTETARVLVPGGRLLATFFLLDPARPIQPTTAMFTFDHATSGAARLNEAAAPEHAVAYPTAWVRERLQRNGLVPREPIWHGRWTGLHGLSGQDIVVADRRNSTNSTH